MRSRVCLYYRYLTNNPATGAAKKEPKGAAVNERSDRVDRGVVAEVETATKSPRPRHPALRSSVERLVNLIPRVAPLLPNLPTMASSSALLSPDSFSWTSAPPPPLSHWSVPLATAGCYIAVVLLLDLRNKQSGGASAFAASVHQNLQAAHNVVLCLGSLVMFLGGLRELVARAGPGLDLGFVICEAPAVGSAGPLYYWSYVYYLSKFYELLDTVLQMLKGRRPPSFLLHVYHHAVVLYMSWGWLEYTMSLQFPGLLFNTLVHVVMYFYFFLKSMGYSPWWKPWVTRLQIVQFMSSAVLFGALMLKVRAGAECNGLYFVFFNLAFNMSLMVQFMGLLTKNGKKKDKGQDKKADSGADGADPAPTPRRSARLSGKRSKKAD